MIASNASLAAVSLSNDTFPSSPISDNLYMHIQQSVIWNFNDANLPQYLIQLLGDLFYTLSGLECISKVCFVPLQALSVKLSKLGIFLSLSCCWKKGEPYIFRQRLC